MLDNLKTALKEGFSVPLAKDGDTPSATLTFAYVSFIVAICSEIYFIFKGDPLAATSTAIIFWGLAVVFYRLRKLDHVKFDLDDKEIELSGHDDEEEKDAAKK